MTTTAQAAPSFGVVAPNSGISGMFKSHFYDAKTWLTDALRIVEQEHQAQPGDDHDSPHCQPLIRKRGI